MKISIKPTEIPVHMDRTDARRAHPIHIAAASHTYPMAAITSH
jgi:hypothetical protein